MEDKFAHLLERCAKQDQIAFKQLYQLSSPKLYNLALHILHKPELAEDVLQESFIKIWQKADTYHLQRARGMTWMATIIRNKSFDVLRRLKVRPKEIEIQYEGLGFASTELEPDHQENLSQDIQRLLEYLRPLQPTQRECILLSHYYGYTHEELSEQLNIPLGTAKAWIRRGLETIRPCLT